MSETGKIDIEYVAKLARIELNADEKEKFSSQLGQILEYFEKLSAIDVSKERACACCLQCVAGRYSERADAG